MNDAEVVFPLLILVIGALILLTILLRAALRHMGIPPLVGFILLGFLVRLVGDQTGFLTPQVHSIFELLAKLGVVVLLFRVGLESDLAGLLGQLRRASYVWLGNVGISLVLSYLVARHLLSLTLVQSCFAAIALTATSVGISVAVWQDKDRLNTASGELLVDVAEMDDISSVVLMVVLFAVAPTLRSGDGNVVLPALRVTGLTLLKLFVFGGFCAMLAIYVERPFTCWCKRVERPPDPMLTLVGVGFIIAALAGAFGFSVAIGGFFAGLVFSSDPAAVKMETAYTSIYDLLAPFFFIGIGLRIAPEAVSSGVLWGSILLAVAIVAKLLGTSGPALVSMSWRPALLLGVSMVPRAEIAMVVMQQGLSRGPWAVTHRSFAAVTFVVVCTCIGAPVIVRRLLTRWPQEESGEE